MTTITPAGVGEVLASINSIRPTIERLSGQGEADRKLAPEVIQAMQQAGLFGLWVPKEAGGKELDLRTLVVAVESISRADPSAGWVFANMAAASIQFAYLPAEARDEILAGSNGRPFAGSVASIGRAVPDGDGFRLSGQWRLASGCHHADWLAGAALVFEGEAPVMGPDGMPDVKLMIFPAGESEILDTWHSLGMRGTGSTDFRVENILVPARRVFSLNAMEPLIGGATYRLGVLPPFALALAAVMPAIAQTAIDAFVQVARDKVTGMTQTPMASMPTIHAEVARAQMQVQAARAALLEVADELQASTAGLTPELEIKRRLACVNAGETSRSVVDRMHAFSGTSGIAAGSRIERCLRDIHTASQHFLVAPSWLEKTGQNYFGLGLGMP